MQTVVKQILKAHGYQGALNAEHFDLTLTDRKGTWQPLHIEKHFDSISVAHLRMPDMSWDDIFYDPEVVFNVVKRTTPDGDDVEYWEPTELTQHPTGVYRSKYRYVGNGKQIRRVISDHKFEGDVVRFCNMWAKNLLNQRVWMERDRMKPTSTTHVQFGIGLENAADLTEQRQRLVDCAA